MDEPTRDLMGELAALQTEYAQAIVAYLGDHPEVTVAFLASVESLERIDLRDEKDVRGIIPAMAFGSYVIALGQFLYPRGYSHGQWTLAIRRVIRYLKTGSYLEEWEINYRAL